MVIKKKRDNIKPNEYIWLDKKKRGAHPSVYNIEQDWVAFMSQPY